MEWHHVGCRDHGNGVLHGTERLDSSSIVKIGDKWGFILNKQCGGSVGEKSLREGLRVKGDSC